MATVAQNPPPASSPQGPDTPRPAPLRPPAPRPASGEHARARVAAIKEALVPVMVGLLIGAIFVAVFLAAFHDPRPHHLPVAVMGSQGAPVPSAPPAAGGDALEVRAYPDPAAALAAVQDREVLGAFIVDGSGPALLVAGANGASVSQTLQAAFAPAAAASGGALTVTDVQPLSQGDSRGLSVFYGAFGVVLAGFLFGLTSVQTAPRLSAGWRAVSLAAFSALAGLALAALLQPVFDALPAPYLSTATVIALLALAIAATTTALLKALGPAGTFVAAVLLLVFGNATSTGILPQQYLPSWLELLAEVLPVGVAARALRGAAYFDGDGLGSGAVVLLAWAAGAALLFTVASTVQERRSARTAPDPASNGSRAVGSTSDDASGVRS